MAIEVAERAPFDFDVRVRPGDVVHGLSGLTSHLRTSFDAEHVGEALGEELISLATEDGLRTLDRGLGACGISARMREVRVLDLGRAHPWLMFGAGDAHRPAPLLLVHGYRRRRHLVRSIHMGHVRELAVRTAELSRMLGARSSTVTVRGLAPVMKLPLDLAVDREHDLSPWQRVRALVKVERADIWLCIVYGIAIGLLSLVTPIAVQSLVNTVAFGSVVQPLIVLTVLLAIGLAFSGLVRILQAVVVEALQERMFIRAVADLARRFANVELATLEHLHPPELTHRFLEITAMQKGLVTLLIDGIGLLLAVMVGLPLLAFYHPMLLAFSIVLVIALVFVIFVLGIGAVPTAIDESTAKHDAANWLEHILRMRSVVRSRRGRRYALERAERIAMRYRQARRSHFVRLLRHLYGGIGIKILGATVLLGVGGGLVLRHQLTLGQLIAAELIFMSVAASLLKVHKQLETAYDLVASSSKFGKLLDLPLERAGGEFIDGTGPAALELKSVGVVCSDYEVLAGIDLVVERGERIAITGQGGSGKSVLLDVLAAGRQCTVGSYKLDGIDVAFADVVQFRDQVLLVRDPEIMRGTLRDNVRLFRRDVELQELDQIIDLVGLADAVARSSAGLGMQLAASGRPLSRTEVRRVALARALLARGRVLLLDGALDDLGMSPEQHARLLDAVLGADAPWTVLVVSNDPEVLRRCGRRFQLVDRRLEEAR